MAEEEKRRITLMEIIIVIIIIFLLGVIVPGFFSLQGRIKRAMTKGNLSVLRRSLEYYYHKNADTYPGNLNQLIPEYIGQIPNIDLGFFLRYRRTNEVTNYFSDSGKWYYNNATGEVYIDSFRKDEDNKYISEW